MNKSSEDWDKLDDLRKGECAFHFCPLSIVVMPAESFSGTRKWMGSMSRLESNDPLPSGPTISGWVVVTSSTSMLLLNALCAEHGSTG